MAFEISKLKRTILGISIALILALFIGYGINTFYKPPKYEDFCEEKMTRKIIETEEECLAVGGQWNVQPVRVLEEDKTVIEGFCNPDFTCPIPSKNIFDLAPLSSLATIFSVNTKSSQAPLCGIDI